MIRQAKLLFRLLQRHRRGGWLWSYWLRQRAIRDQLPAGAERDVIVSFVDHFEPGDKKGDEFAELSVQTWCEEYTQIAAKFRDSDGIAPQHTWFYRAEYPNFGCIRVLSEFCWKGFGEIEFHLHHGHDDHASFSRKLSEGLEFFGKVGAMVTAEQKPRRQFAYIAGNWALDNGAFDDSKSGCDTELLALKENGCFADFTFPAIGQWAQPRDCNTIYYATDCPKPKSYDVGTEMAVGGTASGDLVIFQGPVYLDLWKGILDDAAVELFYLPHPDRLPRWEHANVSVKGRPEWVFIKLHCHGMQCREVYRSVELEQLFQAMVDRWTRPPYRLHFVNAREAYNIAKAAEAGMNGDAGRFRDWLVPKPANRICYSPKPWKLLHYCRERIEIEFLESGNNELCFWQADGKRLKIGGHFNRLRLDNSGSSIQVTWDAPCSVTIFHSENCEIVCPAPEVKLAVQLACWRSDD